MATDEAQPTLDQLTDHEKTIVHILGLAEQNQVDVALGQAAQMARANPTQWQSTYVLALLLFRMDRYGKAIRTLLGVAESFPDVFEVPHALAAIYGKIGMIGEASFQLKLRDSMGVPERVILVPNWLPNPQEAILYGSEGNLLLERAWRARLMGEHDAGAIALEEYLEINEEDADQTIALARFLIDSGKPKTAIEQLGGKPFLAERGEAFALAAEAFSLLGRFDEVETFASAFISQKEQPSEYQRKIIALSSYSPEFDKDARRAEIKAWKAEYLSEPAKESRVISAGEKHQAVLAVLASNLDLVGPLSIIEGLLLRGRGDGIHINLYVDMPSNEQISPQLRANVSFVRNIYPVDDLTLARIIENDGAIVFLDLAPLTETRRPRLPLLLNTPIRTRLFGDPEVDSPPYIHRVLGDDFVYPNAGPEHMIMEGGLFCLVGIPPSDEDIEQFINVAKSRSKASATIVLAPRDLTPENKQTLEIIFKTAPDLHLEVIIDPRVPEECGAVVSGWIMENKLQRFMTVSDASPEQNHFLMLQSTTDFLLQLPSHLAASNIALWLQFGRPVVHLPGDLNDRHRHMGHSLLANLDLVPKKPVDQDGFLANLKELASDRNKVVALQTRFLRSSQTFLQAEARMRRRLTFDRMLLEAMEQIVQSKQVPDSGAQT